MRVHGTTRFLLLMIITVIFLLLPACSSDPVSVTNQVVTKDQRHIIGVDLQPNPAKILKENILHITLPPSLQKEMKEKTVYIQLFMPGMDHGKLELKATPNENGSYEVPITPTMIGDWVADLRMEGDKETITATYEFDAVR